MTPHISIVCATFCLIIDQKCQKTIITQIDAIHCKAYLCLQRFAHRATHGKGTKTRSQTRGAGERRRAQSAPRGRSRHLVCRQSLLRREGSDPGALRNGAAASRRWRRNQYDRGQFRRLAANLLQGLAGASTDRVAWPAAEPAWPQGGHKVSAEVAAFVVDLKAARPKLTTSQCLDAIETRFGIKVHRRSLERALARKKKRINPD